VQTNCDSWKEIPAKDNGRFNAGQNLVDLVGEDNMNEQRMLYNVLNVEPLSNEETVYCAFFGSF
jgi:hypothetical protein